MWFFPNSPARPAPEPINVRWLAPFDLDAVNRIEFESYPGQPMTIDQIKSYKAMPSSVCVVAEQMTERRGPEVLGFSFYDLSPSCIRIDRLGVAESSRLRGMGRALLQSIIAKCARTNRRYVSVALNEHNDNGRAFLVKCGFRGVGILREQFGLSDAWMFEFHASAVHHQQEKEIEWQSR